MQPGMKTKWLKVLITTGAIAVGFILSIFACRLVEELIQKLQ